MMTRSQSRVMPFKDPLLAFVPLPFRQLYFPSGFPVRVSSNMKCVLDAARESWGSCRQQYEAPPLEARYIICKGPRRHAPNPVFRAQSHLLTMVADEHNYACGDLERGFGSAWITEATVSHLEFFRYTFLEGLVSCLVENRYLVAIHAACVVKDGHGILLTADSGTGKSSLAYACARRGWTYVSDDASSIVRNAAGRIVIGNSTLFRFRPSAPDLFPELQESIPVEPAPVKFRRGKPTFEVRTDSLNIKTAEQAHIDHVVFLHRDPQMSETARITRVTREEAMRRLMPDIWPAEAAVHQERSAAVARLLEASIGKLTYCSLSPAIDALEQVVSRGRI
ncbi:MAG: aldolase [Acidobacteriaceae bacterium]|nr:aldolase [Acidobacteriaceae bacterium]